MSIAYGASSYIYQGAWINWSRGRVFGLTLTLNPSMASTVSAALAIYISIAGSQLWNLFRFALHQNRATPSQRSLYYHQQQVVLRNTGSDLNALWQLLRLALAWRHQRDARVLKTSLPLIAWAFLHFILIVLAGLFSSWLLHIKDRHVLSRSPWCGTFTNSYSNDTQYMTPLNLTVEYENHVKTSYLTAQQHVDLCDLSTEDCSSFNTKPFDWTSEFVSEACPFVSSVCHPDANGSISLDTGYLSSYSDFGFNAQREDRISFRMTALCAPLDNAKYSTGWHDFGSGSGGVPKSKVADALYGSSDGTSNITYTITQPNMACAQRTDAQPYAIDGQYSKPGFITECEEATFFPIPEIKLPTADTSLMLLSFTGSYLQPVNDPWFAAHEMITDNDTFCAGIDQTSYARDFPLSTLGCTQQYQFCKLESPTSTHPGKDQCTPQYGSLQMSEFLASSSTSLFSIRQNATAARIWEAAGDSLFYTAVRALTTFSAPPLKARELFSMELGLPLPDDQWQIEAQYWWRIILTFLQQTSLDYSTGQFAASTDYINVTTPSPDLTQQALHDLCQNQMIEMELWTNYNLFALILMIIIATIIIALGLTIEDIVGYIRQRKLRYSGINGKQDMWVANSGLEMLKTIDEVKNGTLWTRSKTGIPLTNHKSNFVSINDLTNDHLSVEKGVGVISASVKRHMTDLYLKSASQVNSQVALNSPTSHPRQSEPYERIRGITADRDDDFTSNSDAGDIDNFVNTYNAPFMASFQDRIWLQQSQTAS